MSNPGCNETSLKTAVVSERIAIGEGLCFFGMGELMRSCFDQIVLSCGRLPDVISDNNSELWGTFYQGIPVVSPDQLTARAATMNVVITIGRYESVFKQIVKLGVSKIYIAEFERSLFRLGALKQIQESFTNDGVEKNGDLESEVFKGKFALVTGAARGLGFEIARALADVGVGLLLHGRSKESLINILSYCRDRGVEAMAVPADLADIRAVESLGQSVGCDFPQIDFLINNAAISPPADIEGFPHASTELFELCFRVNALAPITLSNIILPGMIKRGHGRVVNITSSISGKPFAMHYACSKAALDKYVIDLYRSLDGSGVSISLVDPGWLRTPMTDFKGLYEPESAINGVLLALMLDVNGCWIPAQDFAAMATQHAINKARQIYCRSLCMSSNGLRQFG
jgi:short-subunit dehydrogenase